MYVMDSHMNEPERCQYIIHNLLTLKNRTSCGFIRELAFTDKCDQFYDLASIRKSYVEFVGAPAMERIVEYKETDEDKRRATQAVFHYTEWTTQRLEYALTWPSWLWYKSVDRIEQAIRTAWSPKS
jgi:hypothetical protein